MTDDRAVKGNILVVDDKPANLRLLSNMLAEQGYKVRSVINGKMALTAISAAPPDLVLLDINMPGMSGYDVCEALKDDEATEDIPIIFISALDETQGKVRAFAAGGVDYVTKPFQIEEVLARVETHLALRNLQKDLEQEITTRDKLIAELDAFAHTVAHDLKNPLTALIGFSGLLEYRHTEMSDSQLLTNLQGISRSARKMANIVEELLLLSSVRKMSEIDMDVLDMSCIVDEACDRLGDMLEEHEAALELPEQWPAAQGHGPWVEEIWVNYISNALKYGGEPPQIVLGASRNDDEVHFWVRDNGPGISSEQQERLFTPFERLGQVRTEGHGLGLSIVQRIAEKLGGRVDVESAVGEGSTFGFTLPAA